jgi:hypothetical protein
MGYGIIIPKLELKLIPTSKFFIYLPEALVLILIIMPLELSRHPIIFILVQ